MRIRSSRSGHTHRGSIAPLLAVLMVTLMAMVAFSVDVGFIAVTRTELQNAADSSSLAGAYVLKSKAAQLAMYHAKNDNQLKHSYYSGANDGRIEAQKYGQKNRGGGEYLIVDLNVGNKQDGDIVLGWMNPHNLSEPMAYQYFPYNSCQTKVYRNESHVGPISLFFARVLGKTVQDVQATATATRLDDPNRIVPIVMYIEDYLNLIDGELDPEKGETDNYTFDPDIPPVGPNDYRGRVSGSRAQPWPDTIHEFRLFPDRGSAPGNFGTIDLGFLNASADDLKRQIIQGLNPYDWEEMRQAGQLREGRLKSSEESPLDISGDPGVSWSIENSIDVIIGQMRTIPLWKTLKKQGTNAQYTIVGWVNVVFVAVESGGGGGKSLYIQPVAPFHIFESPDMNGLGPVKLTR